jgi:hypothetical protein
MPMFVELIVDKPVAYRAARLAACTGRSMFWLLPEPILVHSPGRSP